LDLIREDDGKNKDAVVQDEVSDKPSKESTKIQASPVKSATTKLEPILEDDGKNKDEVGQSEASDKPKEEFDQLMEDIARGTKTLHTLTDKVDRIKRGLDTKPLNEGPNKQLPPRIETLKNLIEEVAHAAATVPGFDRQDLVKSLTGLRGRIHQDIRDKRAEKREETRRQAHNKEVEAARSTERPVIVVGTSRKPWW
jgi:hypothetical protein